MTPPAEEAASLPTVESLDSRTLADTARGQPAGDAHPHAEAPAAAHVDPAGSCTTSRMLQSQYPVAAPSRLRSRSPLSRQVLDVIAGKKKGLSLEEMQAEGLKEKAKKARKPGRRGKKKKLRFVKMRLAGRIFVPFRFSSAGRPQQARASQHAGGSYQAAEKELQAHAGHDGEGICRTDRAAPGRYHAQADGYGPDAHIQSDDEC